MITRVILPALVLAALGGQAFAQESGGLHLAPNVGRGPVGLAQPLPYVPPPFVTAHDLQNGMTASDHQALNQKMITALRGDPGFLSGFSFGTPLAASRQPPIPQQAWSTDPAPIIIDNSGPLAVTMGNNNVVQQSSAQGGGPVAQQQIVTTPGTVVGGAGNLVTGDGNIVQRTN